MNRFPWLMLTLVVLGACAGDEPAVDEHAEGEEHAEEAATGPNGGRLLEQEGFTLELAIYDTGEGLWRYARSVFFIGVVTQIITALAFMFSCFKMKPAAATILTLKLPGNGLGWSVG